MSNLVWLALIMCPLIMIPMMYFMMKGNHSDQDKHKRSDHLMQEMEQLKIQNEMMMKEIQDIKKTP